MTALIVLLCFVSCGADAGRLSRTSQTSAETSARQTSPETSAATSETQTEPPPETTAEETAPPEPAVVSMTFAGDCCFGSINGYGGELYFPSVYANAPSVTYPFDLVKHVFETDDITVINFEGTLTEATKEADKTWRFKGPASYADILPLSSVEVALLSNNHAYDYLEQGYNDTLYNLSASGVNLVYENAPFITEVNGVEVVIIGDNSIIGENTTVTGSVSSRVMS